MLVIGWLVQLSGYKVVDRRVKLTYLFASGGSTFLFISTFFFHSFFVQKKKKKKKKKIFKKKKIRVLYQMERYSIQQTASENIVHDKSVDYYYVTMSTTLLGHCCFLSQGTQQVCLFPTIKPIERLWFYKLILPFI